MLDSLDRPNIKRMDLTPASALAAAVPCPSSVSRALLERLAVENGARIRDAHTLDLNFGETTITDICLLDVKRARLPNVDLLAARGRMEPDNGFDWEWFIQYPGTGWYRFSVQAKKLNPRTQKYESLRHRVGESLHFQIELLESFAQSQRSIPLYAFYNATDGGSQVPWNCALSRDLEQLGCTLVPLEDVRPIHDQRMRKDFVAVHGGLRAYPWRCIVCPRMIPPAGMPMSPAPGTGPVPPGFPIWMWYFLAIRSVVTP